MTNGTLWDNSRLFLLVLLMVANFSSATGQSNEAFDKKVYVNDFTNTLSKKDIKAIRNHVRATYNQKKFVYYAGVYNKRSKDPLFLGRSYAVENTVGTLNNREILIVINNTSKSGRIYIPIYYDKYVSKEVVTQVEFQHLNENIKDGRVKEAIISSIDAITTIILKNIENAKRIQKLEEKEDEYTAEFMNTFFFFLILGGGYLLLWLYKLTKPGERFEVTEFHSYARASTLTRITVGGLTAILAFIVMYNYIFYYDELIYASFLLLPVLVPLTNIVLFTGYVVSDIIYTRKFGNLSFKRDDATLSPVAASLLINPKINAIDLLRITFYNLLITKKLRLEHEWRSIGRRGEQRKYTYVMRGENFDYKNAEEFERPFLKHFLRLSDDKGYYFVHFVKKVVDELPGLWYFKKNLVSIKLVEQGLLEIIPWNLNIMKLSARGSSLKHKWVKKTAQCRNLMTQLLQADGDGAYERLEKVDKYFLLIKDFDKLIDELYTKLASEKPGFNCYHLPTGPFLTEEFASDEFARFMEYAHRKAIVADEE
ncbi:MAG: hypothetical protein AAFX87_06610 [Bacteroidota bacterium]